MDSEENNDLICPFCGKPVSSSDKTCKSCGKSLTNGHENGSKKGIGKALSEKYLERLSELGRKKKGEYATPEEKRITIEMFSLVPNIGRARAENFWKAGFRSIDDLRNASIDEIAQVKGIGRTLAEKIHKGLETSDTDVKRRELLLCPGCGALLSSNVTKCGLCGTKIKDDDLLEEEEVVEEPKHKITEINFCPNCGALIRYGDAKCSKCDYIITEMELAELEEQLDAFGKELEEEEHPDLYLCPDCGAFISPNDKSCPKCGLDFGDVEFEEEEAEELEDMESRLDRLEKELKMDEEKPDLFLCPECGAFLAPDAKECRSCQSGRG
jgi:ribosomal protein L40E